MKRIRFISRKIGISKAQYDMIIKSYGLKPASIVLDAFELEKLFKLPGDLFVAIVENEIYEDLFYQTVTIVYEENGRYYEQYFYSHK